MVSTPMTAAAARDALLAALPGVDRSTAALLLALVWIETAGGHLQNWNAGNITASSRYGGKAWLPPWFRPSTDPHLQGLHERMLAGTAPSAFRAYSTPAEGWGDFVHTLKSTFPTVLQAAGTGDPAAFVHALHDSGYSRDYTARHIGPISQLRDKFEALVSHLPAGRGFALAGGGALALLAVIFFITNARDDRRKHGRA